MRTEEQYTALNAISRKCNDQLKKIDKKDLPAMRSITDKFAEQAKCLGFSKMEMMLQIGYINGRFTNHRLEW